MSARPRVTRTFGELTRFDSVLLCSFCKQYKPAAKYSDRRYICRDCATARAGTVLPRVIRHERFLARLERIRTAGNYGEC